MKEEYKDGIDKLRQRLYRKGENFEEREEDIRIRDKTTPQPPSYWRTKEEIMDGKLRKSMKKIFWILIAVFIILLAGASYFLFFGSNIISGRNINLEISAPSSVEGGKPVNMNIFIENKNKSMLDTADLIFEFPDNTFSADGNSLTRERIILGKINSGEVRNKSIEAVFFGSENEEKTVKVSLEYRLADSNAIFAKDTEYVVRISKAPIGVSISLPTETTSKQEMNIKIEAVSNSETVTRNAFLQVIYPAGFQFIDADIQPISNNNTWSLGDIAPLQKKEINIKGFIEGQDLEEKAFNAMVGTMKDDGSLQSYGNGSSVVVIKKPALDLSIFINDKNEENNIIQAGNQVRVDLQWLNNSPSMIRDAKIEMVIGGNGYDEQTISVQNGSYRTFDKKIIWNSQSLSDLSSINPGATGKAQFSFNIKNPLPINSSADKNFSVSLNGQISGTGTSDQVENTEITNTASANIKVASSLRLSSYALHYTGPFNNSGPMPPKTGSNTTYTIVWSVGNNSNDFSKVKVSGLLPIYVRWLNNISPSGTDVVFNEKDNSIVWNVNNVPPGASMISPAKEISFQIEFSPGPNQIGQSPDLLTNTKLEGYDNFVEQSLNINLPSVNLNLSQDPQFKYSEGKVVQ